MKRRSFLKTTMVAGALPVLPAMAKPRGWNPHYIDTRFGRIACVDHGQGQAALFVHGWPLNSHQWRGAVSRLSHLRRCVAPDLMGLGHTEVAAGTDLSPQAQADMLVELLDTLHIDQVDLVSNDSGTAIAQLLAVAHPKRVRTMLITNGDVHTNSPPPGLLPVLEQARQGTLIKFFERNLEDLAFARSSAGLGGLAYTNPSFVTRDLLEAYLRPIVSSQLRRTQSQEYGAAFLPTPLPAIEPQLRQLRIPVRILWGTGDALFGSEWAYWLDATLPDSRGVRLVCGANLFFPEELPNLIASEARALWAMTEHSVPG